MRSDFFNRIGIKPCPAFRSRSLRRNLLQPHVILAEDFLGRPMKQTRKRTGPTPFAKILRSLMTEKKMTLREAAKLAGVAPSTIDDWRGGALPADYLAVKWLAKGLGVSLSFILTGENDLHDSLHLPSVTEVFEDGGALFDGYAKITIQRLIPRKKEET